MLSKNSQPFKIPFTASPQLRSKFYYMQTAGIIHTKRDYRLLRSNLDSLLLLFVLKGAGRLLCRKNYWNEE